MSGNKPDPGEGRTEEKGEMGEQVCWSTELSERLLHVTFCPSASVAISFWPPACVLFDPQCSKL